MKPTKHPSVTSHSTHSFMAEKHFLSDNSSVLLLHEYIMWTIKEEWECHITPPLVLIILWNWFLGRLPGVKLEGEKKTRDKWKWEWQLRQKERPAFLPRGPSVFGLHLRLDRDSWRTAVVTEDRRREGECMETVWIVELALTQGINRVETMEQEQQWHGYVWGGRWCREGDLWPRGECMHGCKGARTWSQRRS